MGRVPDLQSASTSPKLNIPKPQRRRLRTYAFDPMSTRLSGKFLHIDIPFEAELLPGPQGELFQVIDYNAQSNEWYSPVDLNDPWILAQDGLRPSEGDPRTHQQVVYAVAMSVAERVEKFMGRRFRWRSKNLLRLVPHAFEGQNAFFDPQRRAVLFGYYRAHKNDPGANLPGQMIFSCLSSDIIAHEVTHAIIHRLRKRYSEPTNPDVLACHEAFADLVALFQHFVHKDVLYEAVTATQGDLTRNTALLDLAMEFGQSSGRGKALRSAIGSARTPEAFRNATEPHDRGACFVSAVFDAYLDSYQDAIADLLRIATGGSGVVPAGRLHPDLVGRIAKEAAQTADRILGMVVRAFDYLPVLDVTFGDVVRAVVTADSALYPDDQLRLRGNLVEAFRRRGIVPSGVSSLSDESLAWPTPDSAMNLNDARDIDLPGLILAATMDLDPDAAEVKETNQSERLNNLQGALKYWGEANALALGLDPAYAVKLEGIHVAFRQAEDRLAHPEITVQLIQRRRDFEDQTLDANSRTAVWSGVTLIAGADGRVKHIISKPLPLKELRDDCRYWERRYGLAAQLRIESIKEYAQELSYGDPRFTWGGAMSAKGTMFAALHQAEL
ncbi:hypothetical protein [Arthrobacter sp. ZGTC412]|uniref:hypothetical protein n=1 Tax=Arthrobacter sp. ZGTC412 TaxID=2058900 RepID=UPI0011B03D3D|nr:hypothetical protein [Arthrobacter sp. ZGTC412]